MVCDAIATSMTTIKFIDCPPDANDVCASAYCSVIPDPEGPFVEGTDWSKT